MRYKILLVFSIFLSPSLYGQSKNKPIIWVGPADNVKVHGINIAPIIFKIPTKSKVNGINIEGIGIPFFLFMIPQDPNDYADSLVIGNDFNINGITLSPAGLMHPGKVNGIALTPLYTYISKVSGAQLSLFFNISNQLNGISVTLMNSTYKLNGIQIGLINKAKISRGIQLGLINTSTRMKGLQLGLWNINEKRKLPIINW